RASSESDRRRSRRPRRRCDRGREEHRRHRRGAAPRARRGRGAVFLSMPRALGVDLGTRRIGVAISDPRGTVATAYATLERTNDEHDAKAIAEVAAAEEAKLVVLGLPLSL